MEMPTLSELLEAGAHFGHKKERSFPRAKKFVFTIRDSIFVIDLEKTVEGLKNAIEFLQKALQSGQTILFVGTKRQAKETVKKTAENLKMPYVTQHWLGGTLTNFETIHKNLKKLSQLEELVKTEDFQKYTKKERQRIEEKIVRLNLIFGGLRDLSRLPDVLFIVDTAKENVAVSEARKVNIPIIGICDTNANPDLVDFPIPANDDSEKAIQLILGKVEEALNVSKVTVKEAVSQPKLEEKPIRKKTIRKNREVIKK